MQLEYRDIQRADLKTVFELGKEHFGSSAQFSWDWSTSKLEEYLDPSYGTGIVCTNGKIVGFALAQNKYSEQKPDVAWLTYIMVDPNHQGKKIGKTLFDQISSALKKKGVSEIITDVYEDNDQSLRFFEREGFDIRERWFILGRKI